MSKHPQPPPPAAPLESLPFWHAGTAAHFTWFQDVCAGILRATPTFSNVEQIGIIGNRQHGLDIRAKFENRELWGFQCKQLQNCGPSDVTNAINAVPAKPAYKATQYRILLARNASEDARERAREALGWDIIDAAELDEMVRALPTDVRVELVRRFWGPVWVERALGIARAATFVTPQRFFAPFLDHALTLHHDRLLLGRDDEVARLITWQTSSGRAIIVSGRAGIGISRLLLEFGRRADGVVVMPLHGGILDAEALNEIPAGPVTIVVDHDELARLKLLFVYIANDPEKRVIVGCGRAQVQGYVDTLLGVGIASTRLMHFELSVLKRSDTVALAREVVPGLNDDFAEAVVTQAGETPLSTIATAALFAAPTPEAKITIYTEVTGRQRDLIKGHLTENAPPDHVRTTLALVAALGPVRAGDSYLYVAAKALGLERDELDRALGAINAAGGFAERGDKLTVAPSLVRDSLLIEACTTGDVIGSFAQTVYDAVGFHERLFATFASANDAATAIGRPQFFDPLWNRVQHEVIEMDHARRCRFVKATRGVAPFKPNDVVRTLRNVHRTRPADDCQEFGFIHQTMPEAVDREIARVLGDVLQRNTALVPAILGILWDIGAKNDRKAATHLDAGLHVLRDAMSYDGASRDVREAIVTWVEQLLRAADDDRINSIVEILEPALALEFDTSRSRGDHLQIGKHYVTLARMAPFRDRVLAVLLPTLTDAPERRAFAATKIAASLLRYLVPYSSDPADITRLAEEQNRVLDAFAQMVTIVSKLRQMWLRDQLVTFSRRTDAIGERIAEIVASITIDEEAQLLRVATPMLTQHWPFNAAADLHGHTQHEAMLQAERRTVAHRLMRESHDVAALRNQLESTASAIAKAGIGSHLPPLVHALLEVNFDRMIALAQETARDSDTPILTASLAPVLGAALERAPAIGADLVARFQRGNETMRAVAAIALSAPLHSDNVETQEVQQRLAATIHAINDESEQVRKHARFGAACLAKAIPATIPTLVDSYGRDEGETIDWIFSELPLSVDGDIEMEDADYERLIRPLVGMRSLECFALRVLAVGMARFAPMVLDLIEARLRRPYESGLQALPHDPSLRELATAIVRHNRVADVLTMLSRARGDSLRDYDIGALAGELWDLADGEVRAAIRVVLDGRQALEIRAIPVLLGGGTLTKLAGDVDLLVAIVEAAFECGYDVGSGVAGALKRTLLFRPHVRTGRANTEEFVQLAASCESAIQRVTPASESEAFFTDLLFEVQAELERERRDDDEAFGPE